MSIRCFQPLASRLDFGADLEFHQRHRGHSRQHVNELTVQFESSAAVRIETGNFSKRQRLEHAHSGVSQSVLLWAYQCLLWGVSRSRPFSLAGGRLRARNPRHRHEETCAQIRAASNPARLRRLGESSRCGGDRLRQHSHPGRPAGRLRPLESTGRDANENRGPGRPDDRGERRDASPLSRRPDRRAPGMADRRCRPHSHQEPLTALVWVAFPAGFSQPFGRRYRSNVDPRPSQ